MYSGLYSAASVVPNTRGRQPRYESVASYDDDTPSIARSNTTRVPIASSSRAPRSPGMTLPSMHNLMPAATPATHASPFSGASSSSPSPQLPTPHVGPDPGASIHDEDPFVRVPDEVVLEFLNTVPRDPAPGFSPLQFGMPSGLPDFGAPPASFDRPLKNPKVWGSPPHTPQRNAAHGGSAAPVYDAYSPHPTSSAYPHQHTPYSAGPSSSAQPAGHEGMGAGDQRATGDRDMPPHYSQAPQDGSSAPQPQSDIATADDLCRWFTDSQNVLRKEIDEERAMGRNVHFADIMTPAALAAEAILGRFITRRIPRLTPELAAGNLDTQRREAADAFRKLLDIMEGLAGTARNMQSPAPGQLEDIRRQYDDMLGVVEACLQGARSLDEAELKSREQQPQQEQELPPYPEAGATTQPNSPQPQQQPLSTQPLPDFLFTPAPAAEPQPSAGPSSWAREESMDDAAPPPQPFAQAQAGPFTQPADEPSFMEADSVFSAPPPQGPLGYDSQFAAHMQQQPFFGGQFQQPFQQQFFGFEQQQQQQPQGAGIQQDPQPYFAGYQQQQFFEHPQQAAPGQQLFGQQQEDSEMQQDEQQQQQQFFDAQFQQPFQQQAGQQFFGSQQQQPQGAGMQQGESPYFAGFQQQAWPEQQSFGAFSPLSQQQDIPFQQPFVQPPPFAMPQHDGASGTYNHVQPNVASEAPRTVPAEDEEMGSASRPPTPILPTMSLLEAVADIEMLGSPRPAVAIPSSPPPAVAIPSSLSPAAETAPTLSASFQKYRTPPKVRPAVPSSPPPQEENDLGDDAGEPAPPPDDTMFNPLAERLSRHWTLDDHELPSQAEAQQPAPKEEQDTPPRPAPIHPPAISARPVSELPCSLAEWYSTERFEDARQAEQARERERERRALEEQREREKVEKKRQRKLEKERQLEKERALETERRRQGRERERQEEMQREDYSTKKVIATLECLSQKYQRDRERNEENARKRQAEEEKRARAQLRAMAARQREAEEARKEAEKVAKEAKRLRKEATRLRKEEKARKEAELQWQEEERVREEEMRQQQSIRSDAVISAYMRDFFISLAGYAAFRLLF